MRKTTNYNLSQYDATDRVTRAAFNADNAAVDMALKAIATAAANAGSAASAAQTTANSANSAAATAQSTANTAKTNAATAQSTANTAKTNAATAQSTANSALAAAQAAGNCGIEVKVYKGMNTTNNTLTFSHPPQFLYILNPNTTILGEFHVVRDAAHGFYHDFTQMVSVYCEWNGNSVTLRAGSAQNAMNLSPQHYYCIALYSA